jgi:hypothetical protein
MNSTFENKSEKGLQVVYSAWDIWNIAADAAQRATEMKAANPNLITADTVNAIIVAATATEAFINELSNMLSTLDILGRIVVPITPVDWKGVGEVLEQLENAHAPVTTKYLLASILLPNASLSVEKEPYQDFNKLIRVRNDFVHPRAQTEAPKYFKTFVDRGWAYNKDTDEIKLVGWMNQLRTPQVAQWACRAAHNIIYNIVERFAGTSEPMINHLYISLNFHWGKTVDDERVRSK